MLVIRMQRTGRKGHAQFRVVVQDSRRTPTSGKIVAALGNYNPHTKEAVLDKDKAAFYLEHGAQPSDRVARLLKSEGVKLPQWVTLEAKKEGALRNPEKLRRNRPAGAEAPNDEAPDAAETPQDAAEAEAPVTDAAPVEEASETASDEAQAEAPTEAAAEESPTEEATEPPVEEATVAPADDSVQSEGSSDERAETEEDSKDEKKV